MPALRRDATCPISRLERGHKARGYEHRQGDGVSWLFSDKFFIRHGSPPRHLKQDLRAEKAITAEYFSVGKIGRDQLQDYSRRKAMDLAEMERWLSPNLNDK